MACSFQHLLAAASRHQDTAAAIADCVLAVALVSPMRARDVEVHDLRALRPRIAEACRHGRVALVFGGERSGLSRDDVGRCGLAAGLYLPGPRPTLNVAQAVLLAGYEVCGAAGTGPHDPAPTARTVRLATRADVEAVMGAAERALARLGYDTLDARITRRIVARGRAMLQRAGPSWAVVQMLRGLLARLHSDAFSPPEQTGCPVSLEDTAGRSPERSSSRAAQRRRTDTKST
jgi:tRNA C32,U32 (ribose-2'-O)-methylase TrmJ